MRLDDVGRFTIAAGRGVDPDPSLMTGLPQWLTDTVIPVDEIEAFKQQLAEMGAS